MIPIETLKQVSVCYAHAHCPDGLASAMILKDAFRMLGTNPRIEFLAHGTAEHKRAANPYMGDGGTALFCDFAPHPDAFHVERHASWRAAVAHSGSHTIVLDHHKGAEDIVRAFGDRGVFADEKLEPGVSGAVLALREVWDTAREQYEPEPHEGGLRGSVREFAQCVGARDTWQTESPLFQRGQWISKMLMSKPASWWLAPVKDGNAGASPWQHPPYLTEQEIEMGRALFEAHAEAVRQAVEQCVGVSVPNGGYDDGGAPSPTVRLVVFQEQACGFRLCSDVAEALRQQNDRYQYEPSIYQIHVVAGFSYVVDKPGSAPRLLYSLRALGPFDVAAFAKANGGGGHTAAAGFSVDPREIQETEQGEATTPYEYVAARLHEFLEAK
jgi:oligoribonuclease NrnB/cAMP/cGMP phosphodiesterase (DHH superfamily)